MFTLSPVCGRRSRAGWKLRPNAHEGPSPELRAGGRVWARSKQSVASIFDLRRRDDAGQCASAVEAEAIVLKNVRIRIARHRAMLGRWRMAMNDHQPTEATTPRQEWMLNPSPMIFPERCPRRGQSGLRIDGRVNTPVHENGVADPQVVLQMMQPIHHKLA